MSAIVAIARTEYRRVVRDRAMLLMLVLFALVAGYATVAGASWAAARADAIGHALADADDTMAKRRETFVEMVSRGENPNFGLIYATALPFSAALPNAPLAALSAGQAEAYPAAASISPFADPYAIFDAHRTGLENPVVLAAGRFDLAFVIIFLLPLLLIAATYDMWARDVDEGTARLQLAQPIRPASLIATRALVRGGLPLMLAAAIVLALLVAAGARDGGALAAVGAVVLAYGAFWIALTATINLFARTSTVAALGAGGAWLALVILLPAALAAAADIVAPPPSVARYTNAIRATGLEVRAAHADAARAAASAKSERAYPPSLWHSRREIQQRDARLAPLHRAHAEAWAQRQFVGDALRLGSPAVLAQDALDRIAGTDAARALSFQAQARRFAATVRQLAFDWMDQDRLMTLSDYDGGLPRFPFAEPRWQRAVAIDLFAIVVFMCLAFAAAAVRLRRGAGAGALL